MKAHTRRCRWRQCAFLVIIVAAAISFRQADATWSMHWADEFYVGAAWADVWGAGSTAGAARHAFAGTYLSWAYVGGQTYAGRGNARERSGYTIEDRSASKCLRVWMYLTRFRTNLGGVNHSLGSTCPGEWYLFAQEDEDFYFVNTCDPGAPADYLTRAGTLQVDHATNSYPPEVGGWWQYWTRVSTSYGDPNNVNDGSTKYANGCHTIHWWQ